MSFADIFNAYSSKVSAEGRADVITSQPDIPGNVLYALSNALDDTSSEENDDVVAEDQPNSVDTASPSSPKDDLGSDLSAEDHDTLMDSFSSLDESLPTPEEPQAEPAQAESADFSSFDPLPENFDLEESPEEMSLEESAGDEFSLDDDLGLNLLSEDGDVSSDDWDDMPFDLGSEIEAPEFDTDTDLHDLEIEAPEDLHEEINKPAAQELEMPDFSETEIVTNPDIVDPLPEPIEIPEETPLQDNSATTSADFDIFGAMESTIDDVDSAFNLSEEQVFLIRDKINTIKNKNLRFELRNVIIDPKFYGEHYDSILSMLLVNASEEKIAAYVDEFIQNNENDAIMPSVLTKSARATFLADDVENYELFKEDFRRVARRVTIAAVAIITLGVVLWSTVAQPLRIDNLYRRGLTAVREDRFTEGESLYTRAQQVAGSPNLKWTLEYGKVYESKNMVRLAEQKYRIALLIAPKDIPAAKQVASFYTNLTPPNYNNALSIFSKLSSLYPKNFAVWDFYGLIYIGQAKSLSNDINAQNEAYFNAAGVYRDFIIKNINNPAPYYRLLEIYIQLDSVEKINQIYALIEKLEPKEYNIAVLSRLAGYFIDRKQLTEAERIFRRTTPYIDKNITKLADFQKRLNKEFNIPANSISNILGMSYYEFARYNMLSSDILRSIRLLTNALIFAPSNASVHNLMGEAVMISPGGGTERISIAKNHFDNAIKLDNQNYKPYVNLGHLYFYNERVLTDVDDAYAKALYNYRLALNLKPQKDKNFLLNYNLGWLEYRNGNFSDALNLWSDIYKDEPSNPILSYAMGSTFYHLNNPRLAQMEFQKSANSYARITEKVNEPSLNNPRHVEVFSQTARVRNNLGVINANYAVANPSQRIRYEKDALLNFYAAKDAADRIRQIYNNAEYNILVITHPNIRGRSAEFDNTVPKSTTINNKDLEFKRLILEEI